jgi:putative phosphoesterase
MRIVLLSDTHGDLQSDVFPYLQDCDEIWHAGDIGALSLLDQLMALKPCRMVYGNIDNATIRRCVPLWQKFEVEGFKVCMTHIGGRPGKTPVGIKEVLEMERPNLFICGHSHVALVQFDAKKNLLWMNPGACGIKGFHTIRTLFRFCIDEGRCHSLEVIELPRYPSHSESHESKA